MDPFRQVKSVEHMAKIIQHKSQIRALKLKLKMKYLEIRHKFTFKNIIFLTIEYKMCLKILQKLRCLVGFQNRQSSPIGRGKNLVNFEFLKGNLVKKSLPLSTKRKTEHSFELSLSCVSFRGVFLAELSRAPSGHHG